MPGRGASDRLKVRHLVKRRWTVVVFAAIAFLGLAYLFGYGRSPAGQMGMTGKMDMTANHMPMLIASAPDSFTPKPARLPSAGWTATATEQSGSYPARNAIDGHMATICHSTYSQPLLP